MSCRTWMVSTGFENQGSLIRFNVNSLSEINYGIDFDSFPHSPVESCLDDIYVEKQPATLKKKKHLYMRHWLKKLGKLSVTALAATIY